MAFKRASWANHAHGVDSEDHKSCLIQLRVPLPSVDIAIECKDCRGGLDRSGVIKDGHEALTGLSG